MFPHGRRSQHILRFLEQSVTREADVAATWGGKAGPDGPGHMLHVFKRGDVGRKSLNQSLAFHWAIRTVAVMMLQHGRLRGDLLESIGYYVGGQSPTRLGHVCRGRAHTDTLWWTQGRAAQLHAPGAGWYCWVHLKPQQWVVQKGTVRSWQPSDIIHDIVSSLGGRWLSSSCSCYASPYKTSACFERRRYQAEDSDKLERARGSLPACWHLAELLAAGAHPWSQDRLFRTVCIPQLWPGNVHSWQITCHDGFFFIKRNIFMASSSDLVFRNHPNSMFQAPAGWLGLSVAQQILGAESSNEAFDKAWCFCWLQGSPADCSLSLSTSHAEQAP